MRFSAISSLLVGLFVSGVTLAAPAPDTTTATVLTPHGEMPAANAHQVPDGGKVKHVGNEIHLLDANGNVIHVAQNSGGSSSTLGRKASATSSAVEPLQTGWIAYASWYNSGSPISSFTTTWAVPPTPASNDGQTLFYFNSIEPASFDGILQPVLQYGGSAAGGGAYWAVASWYLSGNNTYYTSLITTSSGAVLDGSITLSSSSGSSYTYVSEFSNLGAAIEVEDVAELVWATLTLEAYGISQISDYPNESTVFYNTDIDTTTGTPSFSWSTNSDSADGIYATVNSDGATNAEVTVSY